MSNEQSVTKEPSPSVNSSMSLLTGFLDSEERYELYVVKAAERPHLLLLDDDDSNSESHDEKKECRENHTASSTNDSDESELPPPLVDGCDIPGWRHEKLIPITDEIQGVLNVGIAAPFLRRQGQWPIVKLKNTSSQWEKLRNVLLEPPSRTFTGAPTIDIQQASEMVPLHVMSDNNEKNKSSHCSFSADSSETTKQKQTMSRYVTRFARDWEQKNFPVIITNATNDWKAMPRQQQQRQQNESETKLDIHKADDNEGWTFQNLVSRFQNVSWRFSDQHGEMMTLGTYNKYISNPEGTTDDSPLAIYDAEFGDDEPTCQLLKEYTVPPCFSPDLFGMSIPTATADDDNEPNSSFRPPYRWILIGPARSGTGAYFEKYLLF